MLNISNYYEQLVIDHLWKITETSPDDGMSQTFLEDVACLALNQLPSCYVRNPIDKGISLNESQYQEMVEAVEAAIRLAVQKVRLQPHDNRDVES
jgi:hypothetical protein